MSFNKPFPCNYNKLNGSLVQRQSLNIFHSIENDLRNLGPERFTSIYDELPSLVTVANLRQDTPC